MKKTRYILAEFAPSAKHKKYYRRGGVVFHKGQRQLIDTDKIGKERTSAILADDCIVVRPLTVKEAEKWQERQAEPDDGKQTDDKALQAELDKMRERLAVAEDARTELERQADQMLEELTAKDDVITELQSKLDELREGAE